MTKQIKLSAALAAVMLAGGAASAMAADVGVSISVSQPGVYGRIDIGQYPQPALVMQQPVIIQQPRAYMAPPQPVYLWVPPGHQKNWGKHCGQYNACGVPVYFVREDWYRQHVEPQRRYDGERGDRGDRGDRGHGHGHGRGHDRDR